VVKFYVIIFHISFRGGSVSTRRTSG